MSEKPKKEAEVLAHRMAEFCDVRVRDTDGQITASGAALTKMAMDGIVAAEARGAADAKAEFSAWKDLIRREAAFTHWKHSSAPAAFEKMVKWLDEAEGGKLAEPARKAAEALAEHKAREKRLANMREDVAFLLEFSLGAARSLVADCHTVEAQTEMVIARAAAEIWQRLGMG